MTRCSALMMISALARSARLIRSSGRLGPGPSCTFQMRNGDAHRFIRPILAKGTVGTKTRGVVFTAYRDRALRVSRIGLADGQTIVCGRRPRRRDHSLPDTKWRKSCPGDAELVG